MTGTPVRLSEGNIYKQMLRICIPLVAGSLMQQLYTIADSVIVGRFIGTSALAATGACDPVINLLIGLLVGISGGAGIAVSQAFGAKDAEQLEMTVHTIIAYGIILGIIFTIVGVLTVPIWLTVMRLPEPVFGYADIYLRIYFSGTLFTMIYNMGASILNSVGNAVRALLFASFSAVLNIFLAIFFIITLHMGIAGAALATVISQLVSCVMIITDLIRTEEQYRLSIRKIRINGEVTGRITKMGLSTGAQNIVRSVANMTVQTCVNMFGAAAIAGYAVFIRMDGIEWLVIISLTVAAQTFAGQNTGAGKYERVRQGARVAIVIGGVYSAIISAIMIIFREPLSGAFTGDPEVIHYAILSMMHFAPFYVLFAAAQVLYGNVSGTGRTVQVLIIYTFAFCIFRIIWVLIAVTNVHTLTSVLRVYPFSWITGIVLMLIYMRRSTWPQGVNNERISGEKTE